MSITHDDPGGLVHNPAFPISKNEYLDGHVVGDGTSGAPGVAFTSDPDLGLWRIGADNAGFSGSLSFRGPAPYVDVDAYGADPTGVADSSAAILAAVNAAASLNLGSHTNRAEVHFGPGIYKIAVTAPLTQTNTTSLRGIHYQGAGMYETILRLAPSGSDLYFYNNGATARMAFNTFADMSFEGLAPASLTAYTDISDNAKGFRLSSTAATGNHEQGFRFFRCRFFALHTVMETAGDATASEIKWFACKIDQIKSVVFAPSNLQSVNHEFFSTDMENLYGSVVVVGANGGGAIKVYGGSVILLSNTGVDTWMFRCVGGTSGMVLFSGTRFELRGDKSNLVSIPTLVGSRVSFENCFFIDSATVTKASWCSIGALSDIHFRRCSWQESNGEFIKFVLVGASNQGENGSIIFETCQLQNDWSDKCTMTSGFGQFSAINCYGASVGATDPNAGNSFAHDFDMHWDAATAGQAAVWAPSGSTLGADGGTARSSWRLKVATIKRPKDFWPDTSEWTLKLPKNAIIKGIHLRKPPHASEATSVTLNVGRDDESGTPHLSVTANWNTIHSGDLDNYFYHVGSTTNERKLRLYTAQNPTGTVQGGIAIVEYY